MEKFSNECTSANFVKLDVDEVPDVAAELGIRNIPTFVIFKHGERVQEANAKGLLAAIKVAVGEE